MVKVLIIDDESKARSLLQAIINQKCPQVSEIFFASDLPSGINSIKENSPELVFLDIEMPEYNGLQLLEFIAPEEINFEIIFTTAYSEYAIKAFDLNAVSYLLKPLQPEQVKQSIEKAVKQRLDKEVSQNLIELKKSLDSNLINKVALPNAEGFVFVEFDDIVLCRADGMYTRVKTQNNGEILVSKPLKYLVERLENLSTFFRPHRSYIINLKFVKQFVKSAGNYIVMENGDEASLSKEKKDEFLSIIS